MGKPVNDPNDPAGYSCAYTNTSNAANLTCHNSSYKQDREESKQSNSTEGATFTHAFTNNNTNKHYHHSTTETLSTTLTKDTPVSRLTRDLVGNYKEFRIETNDCDLRVIGNGNRIRINCNHGNLQIIGNSTRLKITTNNGNIRYTGNDGRICLGNESSQQTVDYTGNNGKLIVVNTTELVYEKSKAHKQKTRKATTTCTEKKCAASAASSTETVFSTRTTGKTMKAKSASFDDDWSVQCDQFNELLQNRDWKSEYSASLPNLKGEVAAKSTLDGSKQPGKFTESSRSGSKSNNSCKIDSNINIVTNAGNVSIKNVVNVSM